MMIDASMEKMQSNRQQKVDAGEECCKWDGEQEQAFGRGLRVVLLVQHLPLPQASCACRSSPHSGKIQPLDARSGNRAPALDER